MGYEKGRSGTRGLRPCVYEATLPNGQIIEKRTFIVHSAEAYVGCFRDPDTRKWHTSGVFHAPLIDEFQQVFVKARRKY